MSTSARTTIKAAMEEFVALLREHLVSVPPTVEAPFAQVLVGPVGEAEPVRPSLMVWLIKAMPVGAMDDDKLMRITMGMRVAADVQVADSHNTLLDVIGAVDDYLDSLIDVGVLSGANGFDEREWSFDYPPVRAGARLAVGKASQSFVVNVQRGFNREPAV